MSEWIKVSDRLPESSGEYIVTLTYEELGKTKRAVTVASYFTDNAPYSPWYVGGEQELLITHWMPFPDPPENEPSVFAKAVHRSNDAN